ncbi:MAG: hypothetical protein AB1421_12700 [Pseudomonadota bacterium]
MTTTTSLRNLACGVLCALPAWGLADSLRVPTTLPMHNTVRMNATTVPMVPPAATTPAPVATPTPMARPADPLRVEVGDKTLYAGTMEQQLARLQHKVEVLEQRLAQAEKRLANHRHAYRTPRIQYMSAKSLLGMMWQANDGTKDWLIGLPDSNGQVVERETGPRLLD